MLRPFVFGLAQPAHAQHHDLALARRQAGPVQGEASERAERAGEVEVMGQRLVDVVVGAGGEHRSLGVIGILRAQRRETR
ncbi:hypothetical protein [Pseudaquabacterium terrae]|uniref:hypothetical protein n=1 Tax=Pseudaquabacterium terrae TaxID=2732868 RepID=UPI001FEC70E0|nr:hypothetical protein [Aquabacterium terrae]